MTDVSTSNDSPQAPAPTEDFAPWESADAVQPDMDSAAKIAELEQSLTHDAEAWMAQPGETLSGTIVDVGVRSSEYGIYPAITIRKVDGSELVFHAFRTVALNELKRLQPKVGDLIAILYAGRGEGKDYDAYRIRLSRELTRDIDWDQFTEKKRS